MVQVFMMKAGFQFSLTLVMLFSSFLACATTSLQQAIDAINRQDYSSAYNQLLPLARQGDREAQYYLGSMLVEGKGVAADPEKGVSWLQKSVDNKYHLAAQTLGNMYLSGMGVPWNPQKGAEYILLYEELAPKEETDSGCD